MSSLSLSKVCLSMVGYGTIEKFIFSLISKLEIDSFGNLTSNLSVLAGYHLKVLPFLAVPRH